MNKSLILQRSNDLKLHQDEPKMEANEMCEELVTEECVTFDTNECEVNEETICNNVTQTLCIPSTKDVPDVLIDRCVSSTICQNLVYVLNLVQLFSDDLSETEDNTK